VTLTFAAANVGWKKVLAFVNGDPVIFWKKS
jgi:hypothetical protein